MTNECAGSRVDCRRLLGVAAMMLATSAAPAAAQSVAACQPWVSHAFNAAHASEVDQLRTNYTAQKDPCQESQTAFEPITSKTFGEARYSQAMRIRLNEILIVRVQNLQTLLDQSLCIDRAKTNQQSGPSGPPTTVNGCAPKDIRLFLDGRPIRGLLPEGGAPDVERRSGTLRFHLVRTADSKENWADLLGLDLQRSSGFQRNVRVSVGLAEGDPIPTAVTGFHLVRIRWQWLAGWIVFAAGALGLLVWCGIRTDLFRERSPVVERGQRRPFSLAQCQAGWWTVLTLFSFVFIWLVTGQRDLSGSSLVLLGITAGTLLGARVIDATREGPTSSDPAQQAAIQGALAQKVQLESDLANAEQSVQRQKVAAAGQPNPPNAAALAAAEQAEKDARAKYVAFVENTRNTQPGLIAPRSEGFLVDLVSDNRGVSVHRFQMVAWAAILGVMFLIEVLARLAMPEFDANLLGLLGISSGTYLGLKIPEQKP